MRCLLVVAAVLAVAGGCGSAPPPRTAEPAPTAPAPTAEVTPTAPDPPRRPGDAAQGEKLFAGLGCKGCHGGKGEGGGIGPDLFAGPWDDAKKTSARATVRRGFPDRDPPMPPYQGQVDDRQLDDLLAYVASH